MRTMTLGSNNRAGSVLTHHPVARKALLVCGIASSLLYVVATMLGAMQWPGYSTIDQSVSELIGINATSAPFVVPLYFIYSLLIYAFGLGVWMSAGQKRAVRVAAVLMVAKEVLGLVGLLFARVHLRGIEPTMSDTIHVIITAVGVFLCVFPAMGFGATAFGKKFRLYSIVTILVSLLFGALGGAAAVGIATNLPTPWLGVYERICIFSYLLWIAVLAIALLRTPMDSLRLKDIENSVNSEAAADRVLV
jgi:hypothetical protein